MSINRKLFRPVRTLLQIILVLVVLKILYDSLFIGKFTFWRRKFIVQNDLLDYNDDGLRTGWPFQITKHYHMYDVQPYSSKRKIISSLNLPGDEGMIITVSLKSCLKMFIFNEYYFFL